MTISSFAPGRVNLIGDHTDYMGGLVLPMAVHLGTTVTGERRSGRGPARLVLRSDRLDGAVDIELPVTDPASIEPSWGRYAAGVAALLGTSSGFSGEVHSDLPIGGGLSSSASLEVAVAAALGGPTDPSALAQLCRNAEEAATGVPCGIMDQLAIAAGVAGHALLIDCSTLQWTPVPVPSEAAFWVVDSGVSRRLTSSGYATRRAEAEAAAAEVGPLPLASLADIEAVADPLLRRRARHVRAECDRVTAFAEALSAGDIASAGELMEDSHRSLRDDYEVSTPELDHLVEHLTGIPGVHGARLTGAGFGGCVVALADPEVDLDDGLRVRPSAGVHRVEWDGSSDRFGRALSDDEMASRERLPTKPDEVVLERSADSGGPALRLRPAVLDDAEELHEISCGAPTSRLGQSVEAYDPDELIWRYMPVGPFDDADGYQEFLGGLLERADWRVFVIEDPTDGSLLGSMSLIANRPADLTVEIGAIWCTPVVHGTGVVGAACRMLIEHLFDLGYLRIEWKCHSGNARSQATARRLGFRFEGVQDQLSIMKGRRRDTAWFRLLREEQIGL